ncbi:FkbM family methyltransferase [Plantactinospora veratri]
MSAGAATLIGLIADRVAGNSLSLIGDHPVFASTPYEAEVVLAEFAADGGYLHRMNPLPTRPVVLDVGAHIGLFSLDVLRRRPEARVVAVEPFGSSHAALLRNLVLHRGRTEPVAVRAVLAQQPGRAEIVGCRGGSMLAATTAGEDARTLAETGAVLSRSLPRMLRHGPWGRQVAEAVATDLVDQLFAPARSVVPQTTVSTLIEEYGIRRLSLLKVDVEGDEVRVLAGVDPAHWPLIDAVVVEADVTTMPAVCAMLDRHGLTPVVAGAPQAPGAFARRSRIVRAERGGPPGDGRADPSPAGAGAPGSRHGGAVAEIAAIFAQLHRLSREYWPTGHVLVDAYAAPYAGPLTEPWRERDFRLGLSHGRAWARHLLSAYPPPAPAESDLPAALTRLVGGDWSSVASLLARHPVADVLAARMAALQLIHRAVRLPLGPGAGSDVRIRTEADRPGGPGRRGHERGRVAATAPLRGGPQPRGAVLDLSAGSAGTARLGTGRPLRLRGGVPRLHRRGVDGHDAALGTAPARRGVPGPVGRRCPVGAVSTGGAPRRDRRSCPR